MRLNCSSISIAALSLALAASPALADNLLTNGGFETGDFTGWTPSETNFLLVAPADTVNGAVATATENGYYVFDGIYAAQLGTIDLETLTQLFPVVAGDTYSLTYWLNGDPLSRVDLFTTIFGEDLPNFQVNVTSFWTENSEQFTATTSGIDTLSFAFIDTNGNFLSLDDVDVEDLSSVGTVTLNGAAQTPEPSSLLLLGTGLFGLAAIAIRRSPAVKWRP